RLHFLQTSLERQHHQARLGQLADRLAHALAAEARLLHASIGHVIDAKAGGVVEDHGAHLEALEGMPGLAKIIGKYATLQTVDAVVHGLEAGREGLDPLEVDGATEGLLAREAAVRRHPCQYRWRQQRAP